MTTGALLARSTSTRPSCLGTGADTLLGGPGDDELHGRGYADALDGGPGDDLLDGGAAADDVHGGDDVDRAITGLPDFDLVTDLPIPPEPVTVSLDDLADDGGPYDAYADNVHTDIEEVVGGRRGDTLIGSPGIESLRGGDGDDVLDGLGGPDRVFGDGGDDTLRGRDGVTDLLSCGDGIDAVVGDEIDDTSPSCEQLDLIGPPPVQAPDIGAPAPVPVIIAPAVDVTAPSVQLRGLPSRVRRAKLIERGLRVTLDTGEPVLADVSLERTIARARTAGAGDLVLAARHLTQASGRTRLRLRVARPLRGLVPRRGGRLRVVVRARDPAGNETVLRQRIRLRLIRPPARPVAR